MPPLKKDRVSGFDNGVNRNHQNLKEVTLMLQSNQKIIRHKVGLLNLAEELGNVSKACQMMGLSRDTFYLGLRTRSMWEP